MDSKFTRQEVAEALQGLYAEWRELKKESEGLSDIRLPDYEDMLDSIIMYGMPDW